MLRIMNGSHEARAVSISYKNLHSYTTAHLLSLYGGTSRSLMLPRTVLAPGHTRWCVARLGSAVPITGGRSRTPSPRPRHRAPERFMRVVIEHALRLPCMSSAALDTH